MTTQRLLEKLVEERNKINGLIDYLETFTKRESKKSKGKEILKEVNNTPLRSYKMSAETRSKLSKLRKAYFRTAKGRAQLKKMQESRRLKDSMR